MKANCSKIKLVTVVVECIQIHDYAHLVRNGPWMQIPHQNEELGFMVQGLKPNQAALFGRWKMSHFLSPFIFIPDTDDKDWKDTESQNEKATSTLNRIFGVASLMVNRKLCTFRWLDCGECGQEEI
jgi:hypothetical protein